ncbi:MAG: ABC transporter permease [Candidatus Aminicenantes bacterium]|nr:MAG: ABC transporter permease [Candidatus Aminicenantes bacterium]
MNKGRFLFRSLFFYRKTHLWVVLGTMMSTAILVGALVIGDSVRHSLRKIVFDRLGTTEFALSSGDRFFQVRMADDLAESLNTTVAPLLQTRGIAIAEGGQRRVNDIQVIGVDSRFGEMGGIKERFGQLAPDEAIVNRSLASRLNIRENDEILLRMEKRDVMPKDAPLSLDSDSSLARRFLVKSIAADSALGKFNLRSDQLTPSTVFVSLHFLSKEMGFEGRANVLLVAEKAEASLDLQGVNDALKKAWTLSDAGLELRNIPGRNMVELRSNRIFLAPPVAAAAQEYGKGAQPVLTYFVNELRRGDRATPYSFVSAPGSPLIPPGMKDDEILINGWLAQDLNANVGDQIELTYYILGLGRELQEKKSGFRIIDVVPLEGIYADRDLLPDFPGLSGEENCRDWDPGIPIDLEKIRDKDEEYWDDFRGTPKAFVTLDKARALWANRFGDLTAVRFSISDQAEVESFLINKLDPSDLGFVFRDVKKEGLRASSQSVNFSQLFLGLSFFIIVAALLLTSLLFVFNTENRSEENGLLRALGFSRKAVKWAVLREGAVLVVLGSLLGGVVGVLYNGIILSALKTVWRGAVGTSALHIHFRFSSLLIGVSIGVAVAFFTIWLATWRQIKRPITGLQRGLAKVETIEKKRPNTSLIIGLVSWAALLIILVVADFGRGDQAFLFFFLAGTLFLIGGMAFTRVLLYMLGKNTDAVRLSNVNIGIRNNARKHTRSITLIGLLACGLFIVFTVGANRLNALKDSERRDSGTGGFALFGESSIPILYDLDSQKGTQLYGLDAINSDDVKYVPFRVKEGDDASCLNLNRVTHPQLIGVMPAELAARKSFTFADMSGEIDPENPWMVLDKKLPDGMIPAVADLSVIVWGLGKSVGDVLTYSDEKGKTFPVKLVGGLANSVFQGNIIVSEKTLIQKYPSISGYRIFLVDAPPEKVTTVADRLSWALQDQGLDLTLASTRLAEFNTVQNTYLSIFLILGSFGLLLGSVGLGVVVWRNVNERRGELALLRAVGYNKKSIQAILLSEHVALLVVGILFGIIAALLAVLPTFLTPGAGIPYPTILIILVIVSLNGIIWTFSAALLATKEDLIPALRKE